MEEDQKLLIAINTLSENLNNTVDAKLKIFSEDSKERHQKLYDRIDDNANESRRLIEENAKETRGALLVLGTQVTDLSARFGAHEKHDDLEFERLEKQIESQAQKSEKQSGLIQKISTVIAYIAGTLGLGWIAKKLGEQ